MGIQAASVMPKATRYSRGCGTSTRSTVARCSCTLAETAWHIDKPEGLRNETRQWRTIGKPELFLPCTLGAHEARDHAYSTIRVSASEAGELVDQIRIGADIREADGWCKWSAHYLPAPPGVPRTSGRIDRVGRTNGRHHHPRRFSGASDGRVVTLEFEGTSAVGVTVHALAEGFRSGKRLGLIIRNENADPVYTTGFITSLFQKEGGELFDARQAILGHVQEGGDPSPFDRIQATRLTARCIEFLSEQLESGGRASAMIGFQSGRLQFTDLTSYPTLIDHDVQRPLEQRWMDRRALAKIMRG